MSWTLALEGCFLDLSKSLRSDRMTLASSRLPEVGVLPLCLLCRLRAKTSAAREQRTPETGETG